MKASPSEYQCNLIQQKKKVYNHLDILKNLLEKLILFMITVFKYWKRKGVPWLFKRASSKNRELTSSTMLNNNIFLLLLGSRYYVLCINQVQSCIMVLGVIKEKIKGPFINNEKVTFYSQKPVGVFTEIAKAHRKPSTKI